MIKNPVLTGFHPDPSIIYVDGTFYIANSTFEYFPGVAISKSKDLANCSGFDPSLFHDDDGRKYLVNMEWDYRKEGKHQFSGILLTELDPETLKPISEPVKIFKGTELGLVEGPHLYKRNGYYYLITAEGGTTYEHAVTVARSKNIQGPYEVHPNKHLVTSRFDENAYIKKAGHGSLCEGPDGRWFTAFLCGRPIDENKRCPLGRETAISEVIWIEDWPYLKNGGLTPPVEFEGYGEKKEKRIFEYKFNDENFKLDFMSLRVPAKHEILDDGRLRLYGGQSPMSNHYQNMLVRRQTDFRFEAETCLEFNFNHFQQMAGLIYRYDELNQYILRLSYDEEKGKCLGIIVLNNGEFSMPIEEIPVGEGKIYLKLTVKDTVGRFFYAKEENNWVEIPYDIDVTILSDEYANPLGFTGAFVGMSCIDMRDYSAYADFYYFKYKISD